MNEGTRTRLDHAESLLAGEHTGDAWPRCAAWLIRLAVERELDCFWERRVPAVLGCKRRTQLLALGVVLDGQAQQQATELWTTLSRAAHHHHYELAPTAAELRGWLTEARTLCSRLAGGR